MLTISKLTVEPNEYSPSADPGAYGTTDYDLTEHIGPMFADRKYRIEPLWPMYSFERPAMILWQAVGRRLNQAGWSDERIRDWLQSKSPRHMLYGTLGETIDKLGTLMAEKLISGKES